jgi:hypothetical protein
MFELGPPVKSELLPGASRVRFVQSLTSAGCFRMTAVLQKHRLRAMSDPMNRLPFVSVSP